MMKCTLTLLETSSIQSFVFSSNDLRENVGASELVRLATGKWAFSALDNVTGGAHNVDPVTEAILPAKGNIEDGQLVGEVIYAGGGGMAVLFAGKEPAETARKFVYELSRKVLLDAPGLGLNAAHIDEINFEQDSLYQKKVEAQQRLQGRYHAQPAPMLGLSVTVEDTANGWPAVGLTPRNEPASAQRLAKLAGYQPASERLQGTLKIVTESHYEFTDQIDLLGGQPGVEHYIAIVHIDGNGIANRRLEFEQQYAGTGRQASRAYIQAVRAFSETLKKAATDALVDAAAGLLKAPGVIFPMRPIVFGGDDITLVCDSRYGLTIAADFLAAFRGKTLEDGQPGYATAGIAVVKAHYPFSRAYRLAEELRASARSRVQEVLKSKNGCALDWHIAAGGVMGTLEVIRQREYRTEAGDLLLRPLLTDQADEDHRDWATFMSLWNEYSTWDARSRRAPLREVLRQGADAVEQYRYGRSHEGKIMELPHIATDVECPDGWLNERCMHYDVLEALDQVELEVTV